MAYNCPEFSEIVPPLIKLPHSVGALFLGFPQHKIVPVAPLINALFLNYMEKQGAENQ